MASNYIKSFRSKTLPQALKLAYCQAKRLALQVYSTHDDKGKVRAQGVRALLHSFVQGHSITTAPCVLCVLQRSSSSLVVSSSRDLCQTVHVENKQRSLKYYSFGCIVNNLFVSHSGVSYSRQSLHYA